MKTAAAFVVLFSVGFQLKRQRDKQKPEERRGMKTKKQGCEWSPTWILLSLGKAW